MGGKRVKKYISLSQELTKKASEFTGLKYDIESIGRVFRRTRNICIGIRLALLKLLDYVSKQEMTILTDYNVLSLEFSPETSRAQFSSNISAAR